MFDKYSADGLVGFIEESHEYLLVEDLSKKFKSCTGWIKQFEPPFDANKAARSYLNKRGLKVTPTAIKALHDEWEKIKNTATTKGSAVHLFAENYLVDKPFEITVDYPEIQAVKSFKNDYIGKKWDVHTLEILLYNIDLMLAGQSDLKLKRTEDHSKIIYADYKTGDIDFTNSYNKLLAPFDDFPACKFIKYSIQLSLYRYLDHVDRNNVEESWIVHLKTDGTYELIRALDFKFLYYKDKLMCINLKEMMEQYQEVLKEREIENNYVPVNKIIVPDYLK